MPEGDSVFRAARSLYDALAGSVVTRFDLRVPRLATADLRGETVREVVPRGKHLLMRIGDRTLHSHLKMEGRWDVYAHGVRWRRPAFQARAVVGTARCDAVGFDLAMLDLVATSDEGELVGHLGPDPLGAEWDAAEAARRVGSDSRPIHVALQDQRNVAGLGNEYVNEVLYVRGVAPSRPATQVDVVPLMETAARMLRTNVARPVRTFTGDDRPGRRTWVYRREGKPCRRCGTAIRSGELGAHPTEERIVFWCPHCQN